MSSQKDTLLCAFGISHDLVWNCFIYSAAVVKPAIMKPNTCNPSILTVLTSRSVQPFSINSAELFAWGLPPKTGSFPHPRSAEFNILQDMCSCKYPKCSTLQLPAGQTICALNVSNSKLECVAVARARTQSRGSVQGSPARTEAAPTGMGPPCVPPARGPAIPMASRRRSRLSQRSPLLQLDRAQMQRSGRRGWPSWRPGSWRMPQWRRLSTALAASSLWRYNISFTLLILAQASLAG